MAWKEEPTGRLRILKSREYDEDCISVNRDVQQEWRVWPDEGDPEYSFEQWRDLPEVWG